MNIKKIYLYLPMIGHMINDSGQGVIPALLPLFIMSYNLSYEQAGTLIFANTALASILQPLIGYYSDRISMPRSIAVGVALTGCSIASMGFITSYMGLLVAATMAGIGSAIFHPEGAKLVNRLGGAKKGKAMGTFAVGGSAGFALGPVLAGICAYYIGPHGLIVFAILGLLMGTLFTILMPKIQAYATTIEQTQFQKSGVRMEAKNDWGSFGRLSIIIFARSINFAVLNAFIPLYWITVLHQTPAAGSLALTILFSIGIVVTFLGGLLADRYGCVKVLRYAFLLWVPAVFFITNTHNIYIATALLIPLGFARTVVYSPVVVLGQTYLAKSIGFASGITLGLGITLGGMFTPIVGYFADNYGLQNSLQIVTVMALIALITSFFLSDHNKKTSPLAH